MSGSGIIFRRAETADDADLRRALRENPLQSSVQMTLEREPDYFSGNVMGDDAATMVARVDTPEGRLVGLGTGAFLDVYVNGRSERLGYLGGLRIQPEFRNRIRVIRQGYESFRQLIPNRGTLPFWFTSLSEENTAARRLLEAGLSALPTYRFVGDLETLTFSVHQGRNQKLLQSATEEDIPDLLDLHAEVAATFQFSPVLSAGWLNHLDGRHGLRISDFRLLRRDGRLLGCLALWDQRSFKQAVVRGYESRWRWGRRPYNLYARWTGRPELPQIGSPLDEIFISFSAFRPSAYALAPVAMREVIAEVGARGGRVALIGVSPKNEWGRILKTSIPCHTYQTRIETVYWPDDVEPSLDGRAPQPEIAFL